MNYLQRISVPLLAWIFVVSFVWQSREFSSFNSCASVIPPSQSQPLPNKHPFAILKPEDVGKQEQIQELLAAVETGTGPTGSEELCFLMFSLLKATGNFRNDIRAHICKMTGVSFFHSWFLKETIPFIAGIARRLDVLFPEGLPHITPEHPQKHLRRIQVLALLAASFFGIIPHNQKMLLQAKGHHLRLNELDMYYMGFLNSSSNFRGLLEYFDEMWRVLWSCWERMVQEGSFSRAECSSTCVCEEVHFKGQTFDVSPADELIGFYLRTPTATLFEAPQGVQVVSKNIDIEEIICSSVPLSAFKVDVAGSIIKADGAVQVDFADKYVGGYSMSQFHMGQEELMFVLRPELLVVMLFLDALKDDEALVVKGAEGYVLYRGYEDVYEMEPAFGPSAKIPAGVHWSIHGRTPLDQLQRRDTIITAIDALELVDTEYQYTIQAMKREILKAAVGFQSDPFEEAISDTRAAIATGRWGCHIFGGNNELKSLLQWLAASVSGRRVLFKGLNDKSLLGMQTIIAQLEKKFLTVRGLYDGVVACIQSRPKNTHEAWSLWQALLDLDVKAASYQHTNTIDHCYPKNGQ